jgi:hypothetical protein
VTWRQVECPGARVGAIDARTAEQARTVAGIDTQIVAAVGKLPGGERAYGPRHDRRATQDLGRPGVPARRRTAEALAEPRTERARLDGEQQRVEAAAGPVRYLSTAGVETETAVRWLIPLMVLCCDPGAIALTVAATRR